MQTERFEYFRLLAPPLFRVSLSVKTFELQFHHVTVSANTHQLMAHEVGTAGYWVIGPAYSAAEYLDTAAFQIGIKTRVPTAGEKIMRQAVKDGRAEIVPEPADSLEYKPPPIRKP